MSTSRPQTSAHREHTARPPPLTHGAHEDVIEASFDRAAAYERLGDFEHALEWLDRAARISGDLPPAYRALRDRCIRAEGLRLRPRGREVAS